MGKVKVLALERVAPVEWRIAEEPIGWIFLCTMPGLKPFLAVRTIDVTRSDFFKIAAREKIPTRRSYDTDIFDLFDPLTPADWTILKEIQTYPAHVPYECLFVKSKKKFNPVWIYEMARRVGKKNEIVYVKIAEHKKKPIFGGIIKKEQQEINFRLAPMVKE